MGCKCPTAGHVQLRAQHTRLTWTCLHPALGPQRTLGEEETAGSLHSYFPSYSTELCEQVTWDSLPAPCLSRNLVTPLGPCIQVLQCLYLQFTDEDSQIQRGGVECPSSHNWKAAEPGLSPPASSEPGLPVLQCCPGHRERAHGLGTRQQGDRGRRYLRCALRDQQDFRRERKGGKRAEGTERVSYGGRECKPGPQGRLMVQEEPQAS